MTEVLRLRKFLGLSFLVVNSIGFAACNNSKKLDTEPIPFSTNENKCNQWSVDYGKDVGQGEIRTTEIKYQTQNGLFSRVSISWLKVNPDQLIVDITGQQDGLPGTIQNPPEAYLNIDAPLQNFHTNKNDFTFEFSQEIGKLPVLSVISCPISLEI